ncbi:MAG: cation transporter [Treponema sp.]|nr:cation transporter [Treponema sp.]
MAEMNREKIIVKTSIVGIVVNLFLSGFKAFVGIVSNSIAITLDAVNNLSDALSSVVTIIGAKLAGKSPNKKHPLGYGRIEYLSSMIVAAIVLYAGLTSLVESIKKIIHPETADYSVLSLVIMSVAIVAKIVLGLYVKRTGKKVDSGALMASGLDALFDAILSASVLLSAIIYLIFSLPLEAYVGVVISGFIIKSGIEMLCETLDDIIGKRTDSDLSRQIKHLITEEAEVHGAYDLIINNYGPNKNYASVHIELPDTMTVDEVDRLTRRLEVKVYKETGIVLTGVGVYSLNTSDDEAARIRNEVQKIVLSHDWALQLHGFYVDTKAKTIRFDVVLSFDIKPAEAIPMLCQEVQTAYPDYVLQIVPDLDLSE